jgi:hypothetical protein
MRTEGTKSFPTPFKPINIRRWAGRLTLSLSSLNWQLLLTGAGLFGIFLTALAAIQFATPNLVGNDGYYHIKLAQIMREQGLRPPFTWLPLTILNPEAYYDHHFLYHVLLLPFTYGDLRVGAKWASVIFPAFTFLTGWVLLRGQRVPYAALWSLGLLGVSAAFLYRMSMPRVQAVSLLMLFLTLHVTLTRRYRWLLPLGFLYVWLYDAFPLVLVLVCVFVAMRWLIEGRLDLKPLLYSALGVGLGLVINPYFPDNLVFIYHHLLPKLTDATATRVGNEWYPYRTWTLVENSGLALAAFVAGVFALGWQERRMNTATATLLAISILFGLMLFKSRRFVEYYPAFALLFCAGAWAPLLGRWGRTRFRLRLVMPVIFALVLVPAIWSNVRTTQANLQDSKPYQQYAGASAWLVANTPPGSRIFQTDWDDFTRLYYYNTHNTYTVGLDPTYLQLYDPDLYELWVDITKGRVEAPAQTIAETFGASFVITDLKHKGFIREAKADPQLEEVYRDDYAAIFQVVDSTDDGNRKGG